MAKVGFYLDTPNKESSQIFLRITNKGHRFLIATGERIETKFWNKENQRAKKTTAFPDNPILNKFLNDLEAEAESILLTAKTNSQPISKEYLKEKIKIYLNKGGLQSAGKNSFFSVYDEFLNWAEIKKSKRTIQKYKTLKAQLEEFETKHKLSLSFDSIDIKLFDKLTTFYLRDLEFVNNTFGKYVSTFKTFLNWATDRGYNKKLAYRKFKAPKEDADIVVLTIAELNKLTSLDLSNNKRLAKVRDVFCLGCYTGLRFSDLEQLKPEHVKGSMLQVKTYKTRDTVLVPLREEALTILNKYQEEPKFLPTITNQKTNLYLKELCQLAGIDEKVTTSRYRGAKRIEATKPKYTSSFLLIPPVEPL